MKTRLLRARWRTRMGRNARSLAACSMGFMLLASGGAAHAAALASGDFKVDQPVPEVDQWIFSYNTPLGGSRIVLLDGGSKMTGVDLMMGTLAGTQTATVSGAGTEWTMGAMQIGSVGQSTFFMQGGAKVLLNGTGFASFGFGQADITSTSTLTSGDGRVGSTSGKSAAVAVDGPGSLWDAQAVFIGFANASGGTLGVAGGGDVTASRLEVASAIGSTGGLEVDGGGSTIFSRGSLSVGTKGNGTMDITGGGEVSNTSGNIGGGADAVGTVTVSGTGSKWINRTFLEIGTDGIGDLTVSTGAEVTTASFGSLGYFSGSEGTATVISPGSKWSIISDLYVGTEGKATIDVLAGGYLSSGFTQIGAYSTSNGTIAVSGMNSSWLSTGEIEVGSEGLGRLSLDLGGSAVTGAAYVGRYDGGVGLVTVASADSSWVAGNLIVGNEGIGTVEISAGALVSAADLFVGGAATGRGEILVSGSGSVLSLSGDAFFGGGPTSAMDNANVTLEDGGVLSATEVFLNPRSRLEGDGGVVEALLHNAGGTIAPGESIGSLTIDGDFEQTDGTLEIELAGKLAGQFDLLDVNGGSTFSGGDIHFFFINGFLPRSGDTFKFLLSDSMPIVNFTNLTLSYTGATPGFLYTVTPLADGLLLTALNDAMPEPGSLALFIVGAALFGGRRLRRG